MKTNSREKMLKRMQASLAPRMLLTAAGLALAACQPGVTAWSEEQSPKEITVERISMSMAVTLAADGRSLPPAEAARVRAFLAEQGELSNLRVTLTAIGRQPEASIQVVEDFLVASGLRRLHIARMDGTAAGPGSVEIMTDRYVASPPACPDWSRANIVDGSNMNSSNFGCATSTNLVKMVADPRDLVIGRGLGAHVGPRATQPVRRYGLDDVKPLPQREGNITTDQ
ncbi:MAG: CpaD family pilus assembly lipoprotein [Alphaproteobacteria bacterium]